MGAGWLQRAEPQGLLGFKVYEYEAGSVPLEGLVIELPVGDRQVVGLLPDFYRIPGNVVAVAQLGFADECIVFIEQK